MFFDPRDSPEALNYFGTPVPRPRRAENRTPEAHCYIQTTDQKRPQSPHNKMSLLGKKFPAPIGMI